LVFGILPVRRIPAATTLHKKPARELNEGKLVLHLVEKIEKQLEVLRGRSLTPTSGDP
jgi:hypothetical protein